MGFGRLILFLRLLGLTILKSLIPGWKFFSHPGPFVDLEYNVDGQWRSWREFQHKGTRSFLKLFINPQENYDLFKKSLLENDFAYSSHSEKLNSYKHSQYPTRVVIWEFQGNARVKVLEKIL